MIFLVILLVVLSALALHFVSSDYSKYKFKESITALGGEYIDQTEEERETSIFVRIYKIRYINKEGKQESIFGIWRFSGVELLPEIDGLYC